MPKSIVPVRQDPKSVTGAARQTGQLDLGTEVAALPEVPTFNGTAFVAQLRGIKEQAERVLSGAERALITDEESAAKSTAFLASITKRIAEVDDERKAVTGKFDKLVKGLNALFTTGPSAKLIEAKGIMQGKLQAYLAAERRKAEEAAEAERQRIAAEAAAQATSAVEDGDTGGALEILEAASQIEIKAEKVVIRGLGGSSLAAPRRKVGKVTNLRTFIAWAGSSGAPHALAVCGGIDVGQKELNQLAAVILTANENAKKLGQDPVSIPGFEAEYVESVNAR